MSRLVPEYALEVVMPDGRVYKLTTTTDDQLAMRWLWEIVRKWDTQGSAPIQVRIVRW